MMENVVITGATCMLGIGLIKYLIKQDVNKIVAICSKESCRTERIPNDSRIQIIKCNMEEIESIVEQIDEEYNIFYHLAWQGMKAEERIDSYKQLPNIKYTLNAVKVAKMLGCQTFIGVGSQAEYGNKNIILDEKMSVHPETAYGITKYAAGRLSQAYANKIGMKHIWVRVMSLYGPQDRMDTMIMSALRMFLEDKSAAFTKGEQLWDYLYQDDAAKALALIGEKGRANSIYVLGSGKARTIKEYVEDMLEVLGEGYTARMGEIPYNEQTRMYLCGDIKKLTEDTGFTPETDFKVGIAQTIRAIRNQDVCDL